MAARNMSLAEVFAGPGITVYGNLIGDLQFGEALPANMRVTAQTAYRPALIRAYRFGTGRCVTLPIPFILSVVGDGEDLTQPECSLAPSQAKKWTFPFRAQAVALHPSSGDIEDVLEASAARGIDGGISFDNPRYENGKLCVDAHVWAKISVLGASAHFDERIPVCINIGQPCFTVWDIGFAKLEICYRAPNQICGKLCVGKFGLEKCWEKCVTIPIVTNSVANLQGSHKCECAGQESTATTLDKARENCISVTIQDGKACLNVPYVGDVCVSVPRDIPNGTVAEVCIDTCSRLGILCGAKVSIRVTGVEVATQTWGCC